MATAAPPLLPPPFLPPISQISTPPDSNNLASKQINKTVCEWFESWRPWQQRMLLCGLTDRCSVKQLEALATTLEPVFHRDFVTTVRQRYPSAPFRHMKKREIQKQEDAEKKRQAAEIRTQGSYRNFYPDALPAIEESDLEFFKSLLDEEKAVLSADYLSRDLDPDLDMFASQLSARLIVNAISEVRNDPELLNHPMTFSDTDSSPRSDASPNLLIVSDSPSASPTDDRQGVMTSPKLRSTSPYPYGTDNERRLSMIDEEQGIYSPQSEHSRAGDSPVSDTSKPDSTTPHPQSPDKPETRDENIVHSQISDYDTSEAPPTTAAETITDPLKKSKVKNKRKAGAYNVLDLPPVRVVTQHRHRSAIGTSSDVETVDFFFQDKTDKLGFMQRKVSPVKKPPNMLLPIQKCYKHVKLCSPRRSDGSGDLYVRPHRAKLRGQFKRQLKQIWAWIFEWREYERMALLSDVTKLCDAELINYLCQCLTHRLRDSTDIDQLHDDTLIKIFSYLSYEDIENAGKVCKRWRYLSSVDSLWMTKCRQKGYAVGVPNINSIIRKSRRKSKKIDWKLAYLEVVTIAEEAKSAMRKPDHVTYEEGTPDGMMRVDGKFFPIPPMDDAESDDLPLKRRGTISEFVPVKRGTICQLNDAHGLSLLEDTVAEAEEKESDDEESYIDCDNEYSLFKNDDKNKKSRLRAREESRYDSSFDVSGRIRFEPAKDPISEEDEDGSQQGSTSKPQTKQRRSKRHREEEDPALDIRPELRQAKDLLNKSVSRRALVWKETNKTDTKLKTAKFAGEVKSVQRVRKLQGHLDSVLCIAITRRRLISGSMDRSIRIWDLNTGRSIHKLYGHMGGVRCLYFHGPMLVSGSWDTRIMVWDLVKFTRLAVLNGHRGSISCVEFNDKYIVSASHDKTVRVWYVNSFCLNVIIKGHSQPITCMKLDGNNVITGSSDCTLRLSKLDTGECVRIFTLTDHVTSLCFRHDLIIAGTNAGQCHFINKQTGGVEAAVEVHRAPVNNVLIHSNRFFTASTDGIIREWDLVTMTCVRYLQGPRGPIRDLRVDDRRVISCGDDGTIRIWDTAVLDSNESNESVQAFSHSN